MDRELIELIPINVGHGNQIVPYHVISILNARSMPVRRLREDARKTGKLLDATEGRKTRALVIFSSGHVLLSSNSVETLTERWTHVFKQKSLL
jgi:extracellular matrix regulatory protein A